MFKMVEIEGPRALKPGDVYFDRVGDREDHPLCMVLRNEPPSETTSYVSFESRLVGMVSIPKVEEEV